MSPVFITRIFELINKLYKNLIIVYVFNNNNQNNKMSRAYKNILLIINILDLKLTSLLAF